ncbi:hypothetical protein MRB53_039470 [Persea americana]|nr:hypothetical protein MRB53_039470 [Persea americana]
MSQVKYRAACDHCSNTKTKCPQERPQCGRCRALGRECNYSISLRHGKRPGNASLAHNNKKSRPGSVAGTELPNPHMIDSGSFPAKSDTVWPSVSTATYPTPPSIAPSLTVNANAMYELPRSDDTATSTPSPILGTAWPFDVRNLHLLNEPQARPFVESTSPADTYSSPGSDMNASCERLQQNLEFGSFDELIGLHALPSNPTDQCVKIATETLNSLYDIAQPRQIARNNRQNPSADEGLEHRRQGYAEHYRITVLSLY